MRLTILDRQIEIFMDLSIFIRRFNKLRLLMCGHILFIAWNTRKQFSFRKMRMWVLFSSLPLKQALLLFFGSSTITDQMDHQIRQWLGQWESRQAFAESLQNVNYVMVFHNIYTAHSFPDSFLVLQIHNRVENGFLEPQEIFSYALHSTVFANAKHCVPCCIYALQV